MKYRTLARKEPINNHQNNSSDPSLSDLLKTFANIDTMIASSNKNLITTNTKPKRRSSTSSVSSNSYQTQKQLKENKKILDSVAVNYPFKTISKEILRFIPDSQLNLIENLIRNPDDFITKKKYVTNVDERSYLTVFEYQINDNWIIWDYSTGYVFFTGLWKICGNSKTDIIKLIDKFPNINNQTVKRVRGGFLKIQGTWLPFDIVKDLCKKFCFNVRYCLIPIFGDDFPDQCLKPTDANFGKLIESSTNKRRRRASTNSSGILKPMKFKKNRSKSDSIHNKDYSSNFPLLEMEEILKASKQLHDLSVSFTHPDSPSRESKDSFNYGGFKWSFKDGYDLKILGKDHNNDSVIDDNYELGKLKKSNDFNKFIPKTYDDGFDTLLRAAHQLINNGNEVIKSESKISNPVPNRGKMDISGLLSAD